MSGFVVQGLKSDYRDSSELKNRLYPSNNQTASMEPTLKKKKKKCRFRCMKVWLKGEKAGHAETFVENLPGCPDNIRLGSDGYFWIALLPVSLPAATG